MFIFISSLYPRDDIATLKTHLLNQDLYKDPKWLALLHSNNPNIQNFYLYEDSFDPKLEYLATIEALFDDIKHNKQNIICQYPARMYFIYSHIKDPLFKKLIDTSECKDLNDFLNIVPIDELYLQFAAESEIYPGSSMGHIFLHLKGMVKNDFDTKLGNENLNIKKGDIQEYSIGYFANLSRIFNPLDYFRALFGYLDGFYMLHPYINAEFDYLQNEQRSIYIFKIHTKQLDLFALHLYELKDKKLPYNFINYNCTGGIMNILAILDDGFIFDTKKHFITPLEYIRYLQKNDKIAILDIKTPPKKQNFISQYGHNEILNARNASKLSLTISKDQASLYFAPIYSDIKNVDDSYKELIESRMFSMKLGIEDNDIFIDKIELIRLFSIADIFKTSNFSKLISIDLESNLYNYDKNRIFSSDSNHSNRLFPTIKIGFGMGYYLYKFSFYSMLNLGYRYEIIDNPFASFNIGVIASFSKVKFISDYQIFYDFKANNRGYDSKLSLYTGFNILNQQDLFIEFNSYNNIFKNKKISYEKNKSHSLKIGYSINF